MWVINNQKAQSQTFLKYDMQNILSQLDNEERQIEAMTAAIERAVGRSPSGRDERLTDRCREAKGELEEARRMLSTCSDCISRLEIREWVPDD